MYLSVIFLVLFLAQNLGLVRCPLNDIPASEKVKLRLQWQRETAKWALGRKEHAADVRIWEQERREHVAEQTTWQQERGQHAAEQRVWEQERAEWRAEREEEEQHRLEVVRRSQGVYWTEPRPDRCQSYGTRIYSANLKNIPKDLNWLEVCEEMPPVMIHGQNVSKPAKCDRDVSPPFSRDRVIRIDVLMISAQQGQRSGRHLVYQLRRAELQAVLE